MKTFCTIMLGVMVLGLTSCGCNCNNYNPDLLKDYKPSSSKNFQ